MGKAMKSVQLEQLKEAVCFPVYVFLKNGGVNHFCDKIELRDDERAFTKFRYLISAGEQCTCMSFMRTRQCKHLKMLTSDFSFGTKGVPKEYALSESKSLIEKMATAFPLSSAKWAGTGDEMPRLVQLIALPVLPEESPNDVQLIAWLKEFPDKLKLGVMIRFTE